MKQADCDALVAGEAAIVFLDARLIDGIADEPHDRGFVRVREGRVAETGPMSAYRKAGGDERVVDLAGQTLVPGLIDCHVHFVYSGFRSLEEIDRCPVETAAINGIVNGGLMLDAGYTTVRDVGTIGNVAVAVRDAIAAGKVRGPRVIASGQIIGPTGGMIDTLPSHWSTASGLGVCVDGPGAIVKEVRRQIKNGVDNIKLGASGVEVGRCAYSWMTTLGAEEIAAAVAEAHRWGRTVAIHCQSFDAAKFALRAGADTIEHGTRLDDEALALFAKSRTALVPTLSTLFSVLELGEALNLMPKQREEMAVNKDHWLAAVSRAHQANILIGAGSDIGNRYPHGRNAREIEFLVRAGLSPMQAFKAATGTAARILGKEGTIGALTPGSFADLLVVNGNPLEDVRVLSDPKRIRLVMLEGRAVAGRAIDRSNRPKSPAPFPVTLWRPREPARRADPPSGRA
jgi:imidazolonepropionase-like amidohydrolase